MHLAESSSTLLCLWTGLSLPVALHPASQRRSYLQLRTGQCSRPEGTFTLLLVRTFRRTRPNLKGCADFVRVLCCSSVKDHSGYSPSRRRAPSQNSQQRCYTSLRLGALVPGRGRRNACRSRLQPRPRWDRLAARVEAPLLLLLASPN